MEPSQILLVAAIVVFALYTFRLRTILADRLIYLILIAAGITFVIRPSISSFVASLLGIGRGADLVFYVFIIFSLFHIVNVTSHMNKLERQITILVRRAAIQDAVVGGVGPQHQARSATAIPTGSLARDDG